jgi:hypothetical protein
MSEREQIKKELIEVLNQIPASGSFEGLELANKATELADKFFALKPVQKSGAALNSAPASAPSVDSDKAAA